MSPLKEDTGLRLEIVMLSRADDIYHKNPHQQEDRGDGQICSLVTGRNLAHGKRSVPERAFFAADLHLNRVELVSPTVKQCARLMRVCVPYVAAAVTITTADYPAMRAAVLNGDCTIVEAAKAVAPESLAEHFARATSAEWLECARMVGPAAIWDRMVAPLV